MYKRLYYMLFNYITDAIRALQGGNYRKALDILIKAQQESEELYISSDEDDE